MSCDGKQEWAEMAGRGLGDGGVRAGIVYSKYSPKISSKFHVVRYLLFVAAPARRIGESA